MKRVEEISQNGREFYGSKYYASLAKLIEDQEKTWLGKRVVYRDQKATIVGLVCMEVGEPVVPVILVDGEKNPRLLSMWSAWGYFAHALLVEPRVVIE